MFNPNLKGMGDFNGDVVVKIHGKVLCASYGSPITIHLDDKRIDGDVSVLHADVDRNAVYQVAFLVLEEEFLRDFGKGLSIHQYQAVAFDVDGGT